MDVLEAVQNRTMVRQYSARQISEGQIETIISAGIRAPTAAGSEQWGFVVVESTENRERLYRLLIEAQKSYYTRMLKAPLAEEKVSKWVTAAESGAYKAPLYLAVLIDLRERFCTDQRVEELWAQHSAAAAVENMLLAAWGMGIGGCWFGVPLLHEGAFNGLLGIDGESLRLAAVLGFGYPKDEPKPRSRKKGLTEVVRKI